MSQRPETVTIEINNKKYQVNRGLTILEAAEQNHIYIPTLCAHKELTPFGGCRMCIVEVEKMRGFPTACTTPVEDGMVIRTHTAQVQAERTEILRLILSEHPASCLICDERDECAEYSGTIRKAGVTTGCRYCPNDGQCELGEVARQMGITEIGYPIYYRHLPVKKDDPFFDRDYNLCILCGRCVRMCQEIRTASTLTFKQRGRHVVIGPAYERTHLEAGCEFCGACVSVCPTGALSEKARKWKGKPETEVTTTCSFCGVGCQIRLLVKAGEVIGSLPADDPLVNNGQLCVKGRFCIAEPVNTHRRVKKPCLISNGATRPLSWEEAVEMAADRLSRTPPAKFRMCLSPNLSNEDLYIAQKFGRVVIGSNNIDTSARKHFGPGFGDYLNLLGAAVPLSYLRQTSAILCIGLDTRFSRSVVGVELRKAIKHGAKLFTINPWPHNLTLISHAWLQPAPGMTTRSIRDLVAMTSPSGRRPKASRKTRDPEDKTGQIAAALGRAETCAILVGSDVMDHEDKPALLENISRLAKNIHAGILPLPVHNNLVGSVLMGAYPELLPGGFSSADKEMREKIEQMWKTHLPAFSSRGNIGRQSPKGKRGVLYLAGETDPGEGPPADFVIYQNLYPPGPDTAADLILPTAAFTESDGSFINGEGRVQRVRKAVEPPDEALPDWQIFCHIARKMGVDGFDFPSVADIHAEIADLVDRFGDFESPARDAAPMVIAGKVRDPAHKATGAKKAPRAYPFRLYTSVVEHSYRGVPLSLWAEGLKELPLEGRLDINPDDAGKANISTGDIVVVTSSEFERRWPARIVSGQPRRAVRIAVHPGTFLGDNPIPVRIRKADD